MAYQYILNTGVIVPDTSTTLAQVQGEYQAALGNDLDLTPNTPQGQLITAEVTARNNVIRNNAAMANQLNPTQSAGTFLRSIGALMGIADTPNSRSVATGVTLNGSVGLTIPGGSRATNQQGAIFVLISTVVLTDNGSGQGVGTGTFQAVDIGPILAPAGTLSPADVIVGWSGMNNPTDAVPGGAQMSDYQYFLFRQDALSNQSQNSVDSAQSKLIMLPGVTSIVVRDNSSSTAQTIDGVAMPPNSLWVCVNDDGGVGPDIAQTLLGCKAPGCAWTVSTNSAGAPESYSVTDPLSGQTYAVSFVRSIPVTVFVKITVSNNNSAADLTTAVVDAVSAYASGSLQNNAGLIQGQDVSPFEISGAVVSQVPGCYVSDCQVSLDGSTYVRTPLTMNLWQRANLPNGNILVTVSN